ncbi:hypothetical protein EYF80_048886 [Liparis tanakae]|uniref:Uncharacterized protein n=1 Tax=Liparis tanakae TaxID=230148 RepID=A0A4Z2FJI8_9TELE|nr:hypothetical protein EYF80_048886 [Liparis tanakae]
MCVSCMRPDDSLSSIGGSGGDAQSCAAMLIIELSTTGDDSSDSVDGPDDVDGPPSGEPRSKTSVSDGGVDMTADDGLKTDRLSRYLAGGNLETKTASLGDTVKGSLVNLTTAVSATIGDIGVGTVARTDMFEPEHVSVDAFTSSETEAVCLGNSTRFNV